MHEEDERPPNEKLHAYQFCITCNGCDFCLLTPSEILALPKCLFKGWRLTFRGFICLRSCSHHCNWNWSALHKDERKKDAKRKKLLNLLCIVYLEESMQLEWVNKKNNCRSCSVEKVYKQAHCQILGYFDSSWNLYLIFTCTGLKKRHMKKNLH